MAPREDWSTRLDFPTVLPGPIILAAAAAIVAFGARFWWSPALGVAVGLIIFIGTLVNGGLGDNITDSMPPVMEVGLVTAIVAGAIATSRSRRDRTTGTAVA